MKAVSRFLLILVISSLATTGLKAQILTPVKWSQSLEKTDNNTYTLIFKADIDEGWKIYANDIDEGGPVATEFIFDTLEGLQKKGPLQQLGRKKEKEDHFFDMQLKWFENRAIFRQEFELTGSTGEIAGYLTYMTCDATQCLPPEDIPFHYKIEDGKITSLIETGKEESGEEVAQEESIANKKEIIEEAPEKKKSLWGFLLAGFGSGLLALLTPCVFPMIPLTVSFFTKS